MSTITEPHPRWRPRQGSSARPPDGITTSTTPQPDTGEASSGADTRAIIAATRRLLADPASWRKRQYATDADWYDVDPSSSTAVGWCLTGALMRACTDHSGQVCHREVGGKVDECRCMPAWKLLGEHLQMSAARVECWNDATGRGHTEVLAALDAVATQLEQG